MRLPRAPDFMLTEQKRGFIKLIQQNSLACKEQNQLPEVRLCGYVQSVPTMHT